MDAKQFDDLIARLASGSSRRETVRGVLGGALASVGLPILAEAKNGKGKRKNRKGKGKGDKGKDNKGKDKKDQAQDQGQVSAEAKKKKFCLCRGTSANDCRPGSCVGCEYQGKIGKNKRRRIRDQFPFSFKVSSATECTDTPTTPPPTTSPPTTTTTRPVCGGSCQVGTNTCAQFGNDCVCRGTSVIPGSNGTCTTNPGTCSGQTCTSGADNQCAGLGNNCVCNADGPPGSPGTCGQATTTTTTTTTTTAPPVVCAGTCPSPTCMSPCVCGGVGGDECVEPTPADTCPGGTCTGSGQGSSCDAGCNCIGGSCATCAAEAGACAIDDDCCAGVCCVGSCTTGPCI